MAALVDALVFLPQVEGPVGAEVAVGDEATELEDGFGTGQSLAGPGDVHAVFDR